MFVYPILSFAESKVNYKLNWITPKNMNLEIRLFELPDTYKEKVGKNGYITDIDQLLAKKELKDSKISVDTGEIKYLALVVKNKNKGKLRVYVAPHENSNPESSLDFQFNCLCYHHYYLLENEKYWYRILSMAQMPERSIKSKNITLTHRFVLAPQSEDNKKTEQP